MVMLGLKILCVCGSRGGVWNVTFVALAWLWGGTFSFCDRQRTDDLPVSSGGKNWKSRHCELFSLGTFSSFKTCRLILTTVAKPWARADAHRKGGAPCPLRAKKTEQEKPSRRNPNKVRSRSPGTSSATPAPDSNTESWRSTANQRVGEEASVEPPVANCKPYWSRPSCAGSSASGTEGTVGALGRMGTVV